MGLGPYAIFVLVAGSGSLRVLLLLLICSFCLSVSLLSVCGVVHLLLLLLVCWLLYLLELDGHFRHSTVTPPHYCSYRWSICPQIHHIVRRRSSKELSFVESGLRFCCNDFVVKILLYGFVSQSLFSLCSSPGSWQLKLRYECTKHCSFSGCFYLLPGFHFQFMPKGTFKLCCFYPATPRLSHLSI